MPLSVNVFSAAGQIAPKIRFALLAAVIDAR